MEPPGFRSRSKSIPTLTFLTMCTNSLPYIPLANASLTSLDCPVLRVDTTVSPWAKMVLEVRADTRAWRSTPRMAATRSTLL